MTDPLKSLAALLHRLADWIDPEDPKPDFTILSAHLAPQQDLDLPGHPKAIEHPQWDGCADADDVEIVRAEGFGVYL